MMDAHPGVGFVYGGSLAFTDDQGPEPARIRARSWTIWSGRDWIADRCRDGINVVRSPTVVMRREVVDRIGGYRSHLPHSGDLEMWLRAAAVSDVGMLGGVDQANHRQHGRSMSRAIYGRALHDLQERRLAFETFFESFPDLPDRELRRRSARRAVARLALRHGIAAYGQGVADDELVEACFDLARDLWADAARLPEWRALARRRAVGERWARYAPPFLIRSLLSAVWTRLTWRRWRWCGV